MAQGNRVFGKIMVLQAQDLTGQWKREIHRRGAEDAENTKGSQGGATLAAGIRMHLIAGHRGVDAARGHKTHY